MRVVIFIVLIILVLLVSFLNYLQGFRDGIDAAAWVLDEEIRKKDEELKDDLH